ncbi:MAG: hypothetical protein NTY88_00355 [Bacteroidetes bacterium]|nr:hypothetical protein [Bacteroidota bacterium]
MSAAFWGCYALAFFVSNLCFMAFAQRRKSKFIDWLGVLYFVIGLLLAGTIFVYKDMNPFEREQITTGIITGEKKIHTSRGGYLINIYSYQVAGKEYEGAVHKDDTYMWRYTTGDTIDITFNQDEPSVSCATHTQYWYINKDKEKYLNKVEQGVGRKTFN